MRVPSLFSDEANWNSPDTWEYVHRSRKLWVPIDLPMPATFDDNAMKSWYVRFIAGATD